MDIMPYEHKVQYYETDKMGIVHHSNYIRWFEEARVDFLDQVGLGYEKMEQDGVISPVVSVECHYHGMTRFGESVLLYVRVEKFNGIRLVAAYEVREKETGELRCTGKSTHCYLNEAGHPVNLKKTCPDYYDIYKEAEKLMFPDSF
ncbi:MAG: acyl-CoA thioesterase [Eubacterium sp.]|nr:acyl-CoA thioesterase [Eubacterium sp.]